MAGKVHKFIQDSIHAGIDYMFNRGTTPMIDIVRTQHIVCDNRLLELRVIVYRDIKDAGRIEPDSNPENWNMIFNDLLKNFLNIGTDERSTKTEFFLYGYIVPIELQITEDPVIFLDNVVIEKQKDKIEKVIQYISESATGRTKKEITVMIKNYKAEDRKEIMDKIHNSDEIIVNRQSDCSKKGTTVFLYRNDCNE